MRLVFLTAVLTVGLAAHASTTSQTDSTGPFSTTGSFQSAPLTFAPFDPRTGTLTSLTFAFSGSYNVVVPASGQGYTSDLFFQITSGQVDTGTQLSSAESQEELLAVPYNLSKTSTSTVGSTLAYFTGTSPLTVYFDYDDALGATDTTTGLNVTLTYTYTPTATPPVTVTPEPSSFALLGTGLLGLGGLVKRRFA